MALEKIKWESDGLAASGSEQGPMAGTCEHSNNLQIPQNAEKFLNISAIFNFSRKTLLHGVS